MTDNDYMRIAIDISAKEKFPYGAIIVKDGKIIGRSDAVVKNHGDGLYTHSEYRAVQNAIENGGAGARIGGLYGGLEGATIYSSCQPCLICMGVIFYKQFKKVVYGATLEDSSKYVVKEVETDPEALAKLSKIDIEIVPNVEREYAVSVLRKWSEENKDKY